MTNDNAHAAYSRYEAEMRKLSQLENSSWNRGLSKFFFGEECTPIRLFEAALATDHSLSDLESQFLELLDRPFTRVVDEVSLEEQCNSLFQGILHTLIAACRYRSEAPIDFPSFTTAVERFNTAWPIDATVSDTIGSDSAEKDELFTTAFGAVDKRASAGFFITLDLLGRVLAKTRAQRRDTAHRSVQTHALFYDGGAGYVGLLTVDLIKDGRSAFCPDPYWMGCVGLARCDNPGDPTNFHEAMQRAWRASGIAGTGWRGRWRITKRMPRYDKDYVPDDFPCQFLTGRSLEAATLACLWAAHGGIPGDESFRSDDAMPLDDNLAVTATIAEPPYPESGEEIGIGPVDHVPKKLIAARDAQLDTVYVATDEGKSREEEKFESERKKLREERRQRVGQPAAEAIAEYEGIETQRVSTMGEVFQGLLVCNKYLRDFQMQGREKWLSQWRPGTGLFADDPNPDPRETGQGS